MQPLYSSTYKITPYYVACIINVFHERVDNELPYAVLLNANRTLLNTATVHKAYIRYPVRVLLPVVCRQLAFTKKCTSFSKNDVAELIMSKKKKDKE